MRRILLLYSVQALTCYSNNKRGPFEKREQCSIVSDLFRIILRRVISIVAQSTRVLTFSKKRVWTLQNNRARSWNCAVIFIFCIKILMLCTCSSPRRSSRAFASLFLLQKNKRRLFVFCDYTIHSKSIVVFLATFKTKHVLFISVLYTSFIHTLSLKTHVKH